MTFRWSSESIVAEYKELQANAMALDENGQYALLAGRRNIAVIDLDKPNEIVKRISRTQQKYNVAAAEWNPNIPLQHMFALAAGDKAEIFSWSEGSLTDGITLKAHTRTITDLNWHQIEPNLLATCSIDTFIHIWDTRETRKPSLSLSAIAGASQVKWNKLNSDYLASGHDCDIRIWDRRKSNQPVCYINAHLSKIHGLDWSPNHETQIVSSSNDSTVKFFDILNPRKSEIFINTQNPVWRARYTPFGEGLVTVVVPPLRRGENSLLLWSMMDTSNPVHTFVGHCDIVLEFDWLYRSTSDFNSSEFQLVTWARDNSLRIWKIDPQLLKMCGHTIDEDCLGTDEGNTESSDAETLLGFENGDYRTTFGNEVIEEQEIASKEQQQGSVTSIPSSSSTTNLNVDEEKKAPPRTLSFCESPRDLLSQSPDTPGPRSLSQTPCAVEPAILSLQAITNMANYSLQQEFSALNSFYDSNVDIVSDGEKRNCQVTARRGNYVAILSITFPAKYPNGSCPSFRFVNGTNIDSTTKTELLRVLKSTALQYTSIKKKKGCIEPCIKILVNQMKALLTEERTNVLDIAPLLVSNSYFLQMYGSQQDYSIPFPRTSGARFCSSGYLVCFTRPSWRQNNHRERSTPRSLSALGALINSHYPQLSAGSATSPKYNYLYTPAGHSPLGGDNSVSIAMYYYQDRKLKSKRTKIEEDGSTRLHRNHGIITVYDISKLIIVSKELASTYTLDEDDTIGSCNKNKESAALLGRKDLFQVWSLASNLLSINSLQNKDEDFPFTHHPFGRKLVMSLINHYHWRFDIQTAALLSCIFGEKTSKNNKTKNLDTWKNKSNSSSSSCPSSRGNLRARRHVSVMAKLEMLSSVRTNKQGGGSPYNTIHGINTDGWEVSTIVRHNRSNSEGSLTEAARPAVEHLTLVEEHSEVKKVTVPSLLDPSKADQQNEIRAAYADLLYRWELLDQRAMVKKYTSEYPSNRGIEFLLECSNCGRPCREAQCYYCKKLPHACSICRLPVRGSSNFCMLCGHGGHTIHYKDWFEEFEECPTGCGCKCLVEMEELFG